MAHRTGSISRTERKIARGLRKEEGHLRKGGGKCTIQWCDFIEYQIPHEDLKKVQTLATKRAAERSVHSEKQLSSPSPQFCRSLYHPHNA